ncbi:MAG: hypothetical protein PF448_13685 [Bacteroidales bacterium]|jgi:putative GTP pyrophosphokinase|nr:hypothetical protein [Bacteroidales bacterium]
MDEIVKQFEKKLIEFENFQIKTELLVKDILTANSINFHQITSRLKSKESLQKKIIKKQGYNNLRDITDIVGSRIILYFEDDVDKVAEIIENEFQIDHENSIDKRKIDFDRFGYLSLHYVVSLKKDRLKLIEYRDFKGLKFEIQIRSILQHSWAEIEHDIGYKGKHSIPDKAKRRFSRIAALLETADLEFVQLREELTEYEVNVSNEILINPSKVNLNQASIQSFIDNNSDLAFVDSKIAEKLNINLDRDTNSIEEMIALLEFADITTIKDLIDFYKEFNPCIIEFSSNWREKSHENNEKKGSGVNGISIYDSAYYLISKNKSEKEFSAFYTDYYKGYKFKNREIESRKMKDAYAKMSKSCR